MQGGDVTDFSACRGPAVGRIAAEFRSADIENLGLA